MFALLALSLISASCSITIVTADDAKVSRGLHVGTPERKDGVEITWDRLTESGGEGTWRRGGAKGIVSSRPPDGSTRSYLLASELQRLADVESASSLRISKPAGDLLFTAAEGASNRGTVCFEPNLTYAAAWQRALGVAPTGAEALDLAMADVPMEAAQGYTDAGFKNLKPADVLRLHAHGVTPEFAKGTGRDSLTIDELLRLRQYGVSPDFVKQIADGANGPVEVDEILKYRQYGVSADYVNGIRSLGGSYANGDTIRRFRQHGIAPEYVREMKSLGDVEPEDIIRMRNYGISVDYARGVAEAGYDIKGDTVTRFRQYGVDTAYLKGINPPGRKVLDPEEVIRLRSRGVDAETVRKLRE